MALLLLANGKMLISTDACQSIEGDTGGIRRILLNIERQTSFSHASWSSGVQHRLLICSDGGEKWSIMASEEDIAETIEYLFTLQRSDDKPSEEIKSKKKKFVI